MAVIISWWASITNCAAAGFAGNSCQVILELGRAIPADSAPRARHDHRRKLSAS